MESINIENLDQLACVDSPNHRPETETDAWLAISVETGTSSTCDLTYLDSLYLKIKTKAHNL